MTHKTLAVSALVIGISATAMSASAGLEMQNTYAKVDCTNGKTYYTSMFERDANLNLVRRSERDIIDWATGRCGNDGFSISDGGSGDPFETRYAQVDSLDRRYKVEAMEVNEEYATLTCTGQTTVHIIKDSWCYPNGIADYDRLSDRADKTCGVGNWSIDMPKDKNLTLLKSDRDRLSSTRR